MRHCTAVWLLSVLACSDADKLAAPELQELRLSTHQGLDPLVPPTGASFSASLFELVCPLADGTLDRRQLSAYTIELRRRTDSRPLDVLAKLVRVSGLVSVQVDGDRLLVTVQPDAVSTYICIEDGPYRIVSQSPSEVLLERRGDAGVPRIRVVNVRDNEEEWRRFLARQVDIVPGVNRSQLRYLRELDSVRLTPIDTATSIGLIFNAAKLRREIREAIALAIHRKAVVRALGLDEGAAILSREDTAEAERLIAQYRPANPVRILAFEGQADIRRAALVIEENLSRVGLPVAIEPLGIEESLKRMSAGEFEAVLFIVAPRTPRWWGRFRTGDVDNYTGYSNPEFDAAADRGDVDRVLQIFDRDVLLAPLFRVPEVIAADRGLCEIKPDLIDLTWLSGVRHCAPGETE